MLPSVHCPFITSLATMEALQTATTRRLSWQLPDAGGYWCTANGHDQLAIIPIERAVLRPRRLADSTKVRPA